jgi:hypothetical protein
MNRYPFGYANDKFNSRRRSLHDGVGRESRRHKDHAAVGPGLADSLFYRVENRDIIHFQTALAWGHSGNDIGAVCYTLAGMELPFSAGNPLDKEAGVFVNENTHIFSFVEFVEFVELLSWRIIYILKDTQQTQRTQQAQ